MTIDYFALGVSATQAVIDTQAICDDPEYCDHDHDVDDDREWPGGPMRGDF